MKIGQLLCFVLLSALIGCGDQPDSSQPSQPIEEQLAEIASTEPNPVTPEEFSEVFALGSNSTDLQRDLLKKELIGSVVEWHLLVYDIEFNEGVYKVTSQALPVKSKEAVQLLRAVAFIVPTSDEVHNWMQKAKTNDVITVRGKVRQIILRTVVAIEPAILIIENAKSTAGSLVAKPTIE